MAGVPWPSGAACSSSAIKISHSFLILLYHLSFSFSHSINHLFTSTFVTQSHPNNQLWYCIFPRFSPHCSRFLFVSPFLSLSSLSSWYLILDLHDAVLGDDEHPGDELGVSLIPALLELFPCTLSQYNSPSM